MGGGGESMARKWVGVQSGKLTCPFSKNNNLFAPGGSFLDGQFPSE